jgi:hypothetical protein
VALIHDAKVIGWTRAGKMALFLADQEIANSAPDSLY